MFDIGNQEFVNILWKTDQENITFLCSIDLGHHGKIAILMNCPFRAILFLPNFQFFLTEYFGR